MKFKVRLISIFFIFILVGCVATYYIQLYEDLNRFRYVVVPSLKHQDESIYKYNLVNRLTRLLLDEGFTIITTHEAQRLSVKEQSQVLYSAIRYEYKSYASTVWLDFFDISRKEIYSGKATFSKGWGYQTDLNEALDRAFQRFADEYQGFNPQLIKDPTEAVLDKQPNSTRQQWKSINQ